MTSLLHWDLLLAALRITTPLLFAAAGGLIAWRAGVINLGLEGYMLIGAFAASFGTALTGNVGLGLLLCCAVAAVAALAMGWAIIFKGADQIVTGIMFNVLALGLTTYFGALIQQARGAGSLSTTHQFGPVIGWLRSIPVVGSVFQAVDPFLVAALVAVAVIGYVLKRTPMGLSIIASGEDARAADAAGVPVERIRYGCYVAGSVVAALGGAFLSVSYIGMFTTNMTAGQGYIAIAIIILGRWRPVWVLAASLLVGLAFALQVRQQAASWLPVEVALALPYVLTLVIVAFASRASGPAEEGRPFVRGSR